MAFVTTFTRLVSRAVRHTPAQIKAKGAKQDLYTRDLWLFLGSVIAFFSLVNAAKKLSLSISPRTPETQGKEEGEVVPTNNTRKPSLRRIPAAVASSFRVTAFRIPIPLGFGASASTFEVTLITLYMAVVLVLLLIDTHQLDIWQYEDRAAHFASAQLPLIVALAGKNNIISFLVGIGHEKLNILHRASARTCLLLLWIHAIGRLTQGLPVQFSFEHNWMRAGAVGLAAFTLATILSIRPIRHAAFEFFLISHIILIATFLICGYFHARDPGYGDYIWPALMIWALDRVLRVFRLLWNNSIWRRSRADYSHGSVELLSDDTIRLSLRRRLAWKAGQHAYVVLPSVSNLPTEAHPFTIASIPNSLDGTDGPKEKELVFLCRTREGFTDRMRAQAIKDGKFSVPAFVDGPYGNPPDLTVFSTSVLIAGGSGVSYILPLLMELVCSANAKKSRVNRILFIWSVRNVAHLNWISETLSTTLKAAPSSLHIDVRIFVTGSSSGTPTSQQPTLGYRDPPESPVLDEKEKEIVVLEAPSSPNPSSPLATTLGRPDLYKLLKEEVDTATGPVSVDVCGPASLSASVRAALRSDIASGGSALHGCPTVTLHVETFGM